MGGGILAQARVFCSSKNGLRVAQATNVSLGRGGLSLGQNYSRSS